MVLGRAVPRGQELRAYAALEAGREVVRRVVLEAPADEQHVPRRRVRRIHCEGIKHGATHVEGCCVHEAASGLVEPKQRISLQAALNGRRRIATMAPAHEPQLRHAPCPEPPVRCQQPVLHATQHFDRHGAQDLMVHVGLRWRLREAKAELVWGDHKVAELSEHRHHGVLRRTKPAIVYGQRRVVGVWLAAVRHRSVGEDDNAAGRCTVRRLDEQTGRDMAGAADSHIVCHATEVRGGWLTEKHGVGWCRVGTGRTRGHGDCGADRTSDLQF